MEVLEQAVEETNQIPLQINFEQIPKKALKNKTSINPFLQEAPPKDTEQPYFNRSCWQFPITLGLLGTTMLNYEESRLTGALFLGSSIAIGLIQTYYK